jgi:ribosomal protein S11
MHRELPKPVTAPVLSAVEVAERQLTAAIVEHAAAHVRLVAAGKARRAAERALDAARMAVKL